MPGRKCEAAASARYPIPLPVRFSRGRPFLAGAALARDIPSPQRIGIATGPSLTDSDESVVLSGNLARLLEVS